jgi:hypothetical protein
VSAAHVLLCHAAHTVLHCESFREVSRPSEIPPAGAAASRLRCSVPSRCATTCLCACYSSIQLQLCRTLRHGLKQLCRTLRHGLKRPLQRLHTSSFCTSPLHPAQPRALPWQELLALLRCMRRRTATPTILTPCCHARGDRRILLLKGETATPYDAVQVPRGNLKRYQHEQPQG